MSEYLVTTNELESIANSIRSKTGTSNQLTFPNEFISGINNIHELEIYSYINGNLSEVYNSTITSLTNNIFAYHNLTTISFPECTSIGSYAFYYCSSLTTVSFPKCTFIGQDAFYGCSSLTIASFPNCTSIDSYAFYNCKSLATASFPNCTTISTSAFNYCFELTTISFPNCTSIGSWVFYECFSLTTASFPKCTFIGQNAFYSCTKLTTASFPNCTYISGSAFRSCHRLMSINLTGVSAVTSLINSSAFSSTPIAGYTTSTGGVYGSIFVPSSLVTDFQSATNWTYFSSRIVGV